MTKVLLHENFFSVLDFFFFARNLEIELLYHSLFLFLVFLFFLVGLEFELRALLLQSRCS
jgi:hypothetical protein